MSGHRLVATALTTIGTLIVGIVFFTFDVVVDRTTACVVAGVMATVVVSLLLALPLRLSAGVRGGSGCIRCHNLVGTTAPGEPRFTNCAIALLT